MIGYLLFFLSIFAALALCGETIAKEQLKGLSNDDFRYRKYFGLSEFYWIITVISIFSFVLVVIAGLILI